LPKASEATLAVRPSLRVSHLKVIGEILSRPFLLLWSTIVGILIGVLPAIGGSAANLLADDQAKKFSRCPERFGTGVPEGIIKPLRREFTISTSAKSFSRGHQATLPMCFQIEDGGSRSRVGALGSRSLMLPQFVPTRAVLPFQRLDMTQDILQRLARGAVSHLAQPLREFRAQGEKKFKAAVHFMQFTFLIRHARA
jgi:Tripartite tricarboxylate transporter TctA family